MRLLDLTYTGDAINVRRASDNAVQDIGFDANGDLDTSALATFCAGTDGYVVRWYDQSGNGNDAVQATTSAQPQIVASGSVITTNGKPSLSFFSELIKLDLDVFGYTNFSLFETITTTDTKFMLLHNQGVGFSYVAFINSNVTALDNFGSANLYCNGSFIGATPTWGAVYNASATGSQVIRSMVNASTSAWTDSQYNGYSTYEFSGNVQELVIYPSDQSSNRAGIESNINDYYTIY